MTGYRCYFLDDQDRIQSAEDIEADGLEPAIDRAIVMLGQHPKSRSVELWQGRLRVFASGSHRPRHQCHIYDGAPSQTVPTMATILDRKLKQNLRCLYLNSPSMVAALQRHLASIGVDVERQIARGALILSSTQEHLTDGQFDADRMLLMLEEAVDQSLKDGYDGLWATGDMSWELGSRCTAGDLLAYEWRLEEIFRRNPELSGICQYHTDTLPRELVLHGVAAHRSLFVNETLSRINPHFLPPLSAGAPHAGLGEVVDALCATGRQPA